MTTFRTEYQAQWCQSDEDLFLRRLAREYHELTEAFDQAHCSARYRKGIAVPVGDEWVACMTNSYRVLGTLEHRCLTKGIDPKKLQPAIAAEARRFDEDWVAGRVNLTRVDSSEDTPSL